MPVQEPLIARQVDLRERIDQLLLELARRCGKRPGDLLEELVENAVEQSAQKQQLSKRNGSR